MASDESTDPPVASAGSDGPTTTSPPKYVPQFSATTEMILKRINSGATSSLSSMGITGIPPGYEDMRRNVLQGMKTSMNMELPATPVGGRKTSTKPSRSGSASGSAATPTPGSGKRKGSAKPKSRAGTKRKRAKEESMSEEESEEDDDNMSKLGGDSESDESAEITELPKITQSGRQIVKPQQFVPQAYEPSTKRRAPSRKAQETALCKRCGRGHSPNTNMIVFCDGCNNGWHQQCHDPQVSNEAIADEKTPWFCADCSRKKGIKSGYEPTPKGVSWANKSTEDKRAYLSSLPQPQLVSLLLQATSLHPSLPIFPPPISKPKHPSLTASNSLPFPPSAASAAGLFARADANPSAPMNFIRKVQSPAQGQPHAASAPPTLPIPSAQEDSRESSPNSPPYPKAGTGLMAKLGPDNEDMEWLEDPTGSDAFSHILFADTAAGEVSTNSGSGIGVFNGVMGVGA